MATSVYRTKRPTLTNLGPPPRTRQACKVFTLTVSRLEASCSVMRVCGIPVVLFRHDFSLARLLPFPTQFDIQGRQQKNQPFEGRKYNVAPIYIFTFHRGSAVSMAKRRKTSEARKPYERRIDLAPYQRLMRFVCWMSPTLTAMDVLRMIPESESWTHEQAIRYASDLDDAIAHGVEPLRGGAPGALPVMVRPRIATFKEPLAALVPWAIIGGWTWPTRSRVIQGQTIYYQGDPAKGPVRGVESHGLPYVGGLPLGVRPPVMEQGKPVWLEGELPTVTGLCHLAADLRDILEDLWDSDVERIQHRWGSLALPFPDFLTNGEVRALCRLGPRIRGKITLGVSISYQWRTTWSIQERIRDYDFAAYGAWMLVQLIRDGHAWRVARCTSCEAFFLRIRHDPPDRPARFCSDLCRRAWHNPRRGQTAM
jgi:hypothetical protein